MIQCMIQCICMLGSVPRIVLDWAWRTWIMVLVPQTLMLIHPHTWSLLCQRDLLFRLYLIILS